MSPRPRRTAPASASSGRERIQKILADAGLASRREAEGWILAGRVAINGRVVRQMGARADRRVDRIEVDGRRVGPPVRPETYVLNKPRGVVTTTRDPHAKRTILDLVPSPARLFPVGRLDASSEGLLVLTNDGALAHALSHPSFEVPRTYRVSVEGTLSDRDLARLRRGLRIDGHVARPREVSLVRREAERTVLELTLVEGRKRQIRRMLRAVGHPVRRLVRVRFGPIRLGRLATGSWRPLRPAELRALERLASAAQLRPRTHGARAVSSRARPR